MDNFWSQILEEIYFWAVIAAPWRKKVMMVITDHGVTLILTVDEMMMIGLELIGCKKHCIRRAKKETNINLSFQLCELYL
jgi:hypothetical protein